MNVDLHRFNEAIVADPSVVDAILEKECTLAEVARSARRLGYDFSEVDLRTMVRAPGRQGVKDDAGVVRANGWTMTMSTGWVTGVAWTIVTGPVLVGPVFTLGVIVAL